MCSLSILLSKWDSKLSKHTLIFQTRFGAKNLRQKDLLITKDKPEATLMQSGEDWTWLFDNLRQLMQAKASMWQMVQKDESWKWTPVAL